MNNWADFLSYGEEKQAYFLLDVAYEAHKKIIGFDEIKRKVGLNIELACEVLEGDQSKLTQLIHFLNDPEMENDFGCIYEKIKDEKLVVASLDLASYACGFVSRLAAERLDYKPLPDPVLEAVPEIYEYYRDQAKLLSL